MPAKLEHLECLFHAQLAEAFASEKAHIRELESLRDAAAAERLRDAFSLHLEETRIHITRLERTLHRIDRPRAPCAPRAMQALLHESACYRSAAMEPSVRDAAIICAAQKIEHHEIATYGCLRAYAQLLGQEDAVALLEATLDEERYADEILTELAEEHINELALAERLALT